MKAPLFLFLLIPLTAHSAAGSFDGCKGLTVTRSKDFSQVDVSADLKKAEKRINDLCGKVIPKKLKAIDANAQSCVSGSTVEIGPGLASSMKAQVQSQMSGLDQRVKGACDSMKKSMEEAKQFCGVRKTTLARLNKEIDSIGKLETGQESSLKKTAALYGSAVDAHETTAEAAGEAKSQIYAKLPDKDEARGQQMRTGRESASTSDPKTDKLISEWKSTLTNLAKDNKNKSACVKLAAEGGQLDEMGGILKNNLWPNGKVAARAMARVENADKEKAAEYSAKRSEAAELAGADGMASLQDKREYERASDVSGTEDRPGSGQDASTVGGEAKKMSQEELAKLNKDADTSSRKLEVTAAECKRVGGCKDFTQMKEIFDAADPAKATNVRSPASVAADSSSILGPLDVNPDNMGSLNKSMGVQPKLGASCMFDDGRVNKAGRLNKFGYCVPVQ